MQCPNLLDFGFLLRAAFSQEPEELEDEQSEAEARQGAASGTPPLDSAPVPHPCPGPPLSEKPISCQNARRRRKRIAALLLEGQLPRARTLKKYVQPATPLLTSLAMQNLPVTSCGYHGRPTSPEDAQKPYMLQDLLPLGFELVPWDGL